MPVSSSNSGILCSHVGAVSRAEGCRRLSRGVCNMHARYIRRSVNSPHYRAWSADRSQQSIVIAKRTPILSASLRTHCKHRIWQAKRRSQSIGYRRNGSKVLASEHQKSRLTIWAFRLAITKAEDALDWNERPRTP
jgi:hypothetical protein